MKTSFLLLDFFKLFLCDVYTHTGSKTIQYSFRRSDVPLLYSIRFLVIKPKLLCETLENEKGKILVSYPNKMWQYCQWNPKCGDWHWTNFQMQVALGLWLKMRFIAM